MEELRISATEAKTTINYRKNTAALLQKCREFYQDPEHERAYQEWREKNGRMGMDDRRVYSWRSGRNDDRDYHFREPGQISGMEETA